MTIDAEAVPFRVGVDGYNLALPHGTGIATYGRTLCRTVRSLGHPLDLVYGVSLPADAEAGMRETLFYANLASGEPARRRGRMGRMRRSLALSRRRALLEVPATGRVIAEDFSARVPPFERLFTSGDLFDDAMRHFHNFGRFVEVHMPDPPAIMHWTYPVPVRLAGAANVYTIHDLVPLRLPHTTLDNKGLHETMLRRCIETSAHILTVSEASRNDILEFLDADPAQVTNCYQPVDIGAARDDGRLDARLRRLFDVQRDGYLLFFGAIEPKKNLGRLIEAYLISEVETPLLIVGPEGWSFEKDLRFVTGKDGQGLPATDRIRRIDYLPRDLLLDLVRGARAVLFPSIYEGFGLPLLEALALSTPVVTSNASSLPEVGGNAAIYADPYDVAAIAQAIRSVDEDPALRQRLRDAAPEQVARFSAASYAQRISELYARLVPALGEHGKRPERAK